MSAKKSRVATQVDRVCGARVFSVARWTAVSLGVLLLAAFLSLSAVACGSEQDSVDPTSTSTGQETVTVTDHAGRQVTIPTQVDRVFGSGPTATNLIYTLAPELLIGWNITPTEQEKEYIPAEYRAMTGLGGWFGKNTTGNVEEIIKLAPDVVISLGDIDEAAASDAERIQGLLGVPVVLVDSALVKTGDAYRFIGEILGTRERAEELAVYSDQVLSQAQENAAKLAQEDRVSVYYAEGGKGLHTDPEGSTHTEVFTVVGAQNVANVELQQGYGMSPVSLEQVIAWNPEVIFVASDPAGETNVHEQITTGADWATIQAVKDGRVYEIPHGPFDWVDRPYSIGRILGIPWVGNLLYPGLYDFDMQAKVKEFYELFYHFDLTDAQMQQLMKNAVPTS
ncbi:MAG: ABC transporter substrate-binding protein [Thermoleophilia bacterium]|nr:ABC transporter substrate-binding protein [Thermoleophilia bacterium]